MTEEQLVSDQPNVGSTESDERTPEQKAIDPNDHKRAVGDMLKYKGKVRDLADENEKLKQQILAVENKGLEEQNNFKALYEKSLDQVGSLEDERNSLKENVVFNAKFQAVLPELKRAGFRDDAIKQINRDLLSNLEVEVTSEGRFIVHGASTIADEIKQSHPYYFKQPQPPHVNAGGGNIKNFGEGDKITPAKLFEIEKQCKAGKLPPEKYNEALKAYLKQKKQA